MNILKPVTVFFVVFWAASLVFGDVTDDVFNTAKTDPVQAAKIAVVAPPATSNFQHALGALHDFVQAHGAIDYYRLNDDKYIEYFVVSSAAEGRAECFAVRFVLADDLSRYSYQNVSTELLDSRVALAELYIKRLQRKQTISDIVDGTDIKGHLQDTAQALQNIYEMEKTQGLKLTMTGRANKSTVTLNLSFQNTQGQNAGKLVGHFHVAPNDYGKLLISEGVSFSRG